MTPFSSPNKNAENHPTGPSKNLAFAALLAGAAGIGFAPVLSKLAVNVDGVAGVGSAASTKLAPVAVAFWRMALATPFFWLAVWRSQRRNSRPVLPAGKGGNPESQPLRFDWLLLLPGLFFALDLATWHWSFEFTTVANSTLEANFAAILVPIASYFFMSEKFTPIFAAGALIALAGMARLVGFSLAADGDAWIGDLMGIGVATAYSAYLISSKRLLARYPVKVVMAYVTTACAVFLAVGVWLTPGRFLPATAASWAYLVALSLIAQVFGQGMIALGMSRLPAGFSAVTLIMQPVVAAYLGWIMLNQPMTAGQMATGFVVLCGIVLAKFGTR